MIEESETRATEPGRLLIPGATGVDVALNVAGVGSRSYAFLIDWHIRLLVAIGWFAAGALIVRGHSTFAVAAKLHPLAFGLGAVAPAIAIYSLYHPILEVAMHGRTPGMRMAGVRLIASNGGIPSAGALLIRNVFRLIDALPLFYAVGLISVLVTARSVRIGDLAAGTVLVFDTDPGTGSLERLGALARHSKVAPAALDLANDLLGRWEALSEDRRAVLARALLHNLDPSMDQAELASSDAGVLHARLLALVQSESSRA